jgi:uncharacterized protein YecE (DUF72 family)
MVLIVSGMGRHGCIVHPRSGRKVFVRCVLQVDNRVSRLRFPRRPIELHNIVVFADEVLAVVRLHGGNHGTWNQKGLQTSAERFNYDYNTAELTDLATMIRELGTQADLTQVIFNNNYEDQGQRNARELTRLLAASQAQ